MKDDRVWHKMLTSFDIYRDMDAFNHVRNNHKMFFRSLIGMAKFQRMRGTVDQDILKYDPHGSVVAIQSAIEYSFLKTGSHTWFVDKDIAESMCSAQVDEDLSGLFFPYDTMGIVFEKGFKIGKYPLKSVMIGAPRSKITLDIFKEVVTFGDGDPNLLYFFVDVGENGDTHEINENETNITKWHWKRSYTQADADKTTLTPEETDVISKAIKIACACLILYSYRPEYMSSFVLPRSQRFKFGDQKARSNFKRVMLPGLKILHPSGIEHQETGRTVTGHYRGWVYRTLRHERYKRKADGSFNTVVVPPTVIKGGPPE